VTIKAILDTNVLVSGIFWKGAPFEILQAWQKQRFRLAISDVTEGFNPLGSHPAHTLAIREYGIAWRRLVGDAAENVRELGPEIIIEIARGALKEPFPFTIAPFFERACMQEFQFCQHLFGIIRVFEIDTRGQNGSGWLFVVRERGHRGGEVAQSSHGGSCG
jgi:predicted nucleic acid-binding protein